MDKRVVVPIAAVLLASAAAYTWKKHGAGREEIEREKRVQQELSQVQADLASMRQAMAAGRRPGRGLEAAVMRDPRDPGASPPGSVSAAPPAAPRAKEPSDEEMRDAYAARFVGESFDRAWSTDATTTLREQVVPHLPADAALVDLECRTTLCKLTTSHHDVGAYRAFLQSSLFAPEFKWGGPMTGGIVRTDPNGEVVTVAYLTRPGTKPPTVGQEEARD